MGIKSVRHVTGGNQVRRGKNSAGCCEGQGGGVTPGIQPFPAVTIGVRQWMKPSSLSAIPSRDARLFIDRAHQSQGVRVMEITV